MPTSGKEENQCEETSPKRIKLVEAHSLRINLSKILEKEIRNEINVRRNDLEIIEQRIYQTRQSLVKIRQGIVAEYYKVNSKGILQMPPHPAVKDTFHGKRPAKRSNSCVDDERARGENSNVIATNDTLEEANDDSVNGCESKDQQLKKLPRYIPPIYRDKDVVQLFEPRGNVKKQKFRLSIVNVSKWIFNKEDGGATHKWTLYVKNSDPSVDISLFVSKITFFLHHSYKPNDVITVDYSPFKLTRRGWGEFPLRIQIHFINSLDKPVDVIHQLKLDTTHSGLDTFGNETVVDVWAHVNENERDLTEENVESISINDRLTLEQDEEEIDEHEENKKPLVSPKIEPPESLSSVKSSSAYISDDYLSTSSLSQLSLQSLTQEISNDFLSDLFKENETKQKEEIEMLKAEIESDFSNSNNNHNHKNEITIEEKQETYESCNNYTGFIENISTELIFDGISGQENNSSSITSNSCEQIIQSDPATNIVSELIFDKIPAEQINVKQETLTEPAQITSSTSTSNEFPLEFLNSTQVITKPEEMFETVDFINNDITNTTTTTTTTTTTADYISTDINQTADFIADDINQTADTYNPIECLNFVNDEVIIESEHDEEETSAVNKVQQQNNTSANNNNSLTCKNFLENFVDTEILSSNNDEQIKDDLIDTDQNYIYEIPKILATEQKEQQVRIASSSILPSELNKQSSNTMINLSNTSLKFTHTEQMQSLQKDTLNTNCFNNSSSTSTNTSICVNIYKNLNQIKSKTNAKKILIEDVNIIKKLKISPIKKNQVKLNRKVGGNVNKLVKNRNDAIIFVNNGDDVLNRNTSGNLVNSLSGTNPVCSSSPVVNRDQVTLADLNRLGSNDNLKQKLFIEMPDGKLREICSVKPANETLPSKPIIIEPTPVQKRRNPPLELPIKPKDVNIIKKVILINNNAAMKILPAAAAAASTTKLNQTTKLKLNEPFNNQKRLILPIKTAQKSKQSILRPAIVASGSSSQSAVVKSMVNQTNSPQFIKFVPRSNLISENIVIQRKVLPGESLLKKGNQVQAQEVVTVAPTLQQVQGSSAFVQQRPQVSTLSAPVLTDKISIERCPKESIEYAVNWLIKQFPLVNEKAGHEHFKMQHPYCAVDRVTFLRWPLAKQRASEWIRAKKVGELLLKVCPDLKRWSTLQIIDWARLRGYTPLAVPLRCKNVNNVNIDSSFKYTAPDLNSILMKNEKHNAEEINIDVVSQSETDCKNKSISSNEDRLYISIDDNKYKQLGDYIYKSCDRLGYHFYEEDILSGVIYPAAERSLVSVFCSLFDDLFRRSLNASAMRNGIMPATEITLDDVKLAILSRKEFDIFTNEGLG